MPPRPAPPPAAMPPTTSPSRSKSNDAGSTTGIHAIPPPLPPQPPAQHSNLTNCSINSHANQFHLDRCFLPSQILYTQVPPPQSASLISGQSQKESPPPFIHAGHVSVKICFGALCPNRKESSVHHRLIFSRRSSVGIGGGRK